jgi:hypothetical protein
MPILPSETRRAFDLKTIKAEQSSETAQREKTEKAEMPDSGPPPKERGKVGTYLNAKA